MLNKECEVLIIQGVLFVHSGDSLWKKSEIQIICKVEHRTIYERLRDVLSYFGFITSLSIYNYDGRNELSCPYLKRKNFILANSENEYYQIKQAMEKIVSINDTYTPNTFRVEYIRIPDVQKQNSYFYKEYIFNKLDEPSFTSDEFMSMIGLRLEMLSDGKPDYGKYLSELKYTYSSSPCGRYFFYRVRFDEIMADNGDRKRLLELCKEIKDYIDNNKPDAIKTEFLYAQILDFDLEDYQEAVESYKEVLGVVDNNSVFFYFYASALLKLTNNLGNENKITEALDKATGALERAIYYDKASYAAYYKLARLYERKNDKVQTVRYYGKAMDSLEYIRRQDFLTDHEAEYYSYCLNQLSIIQSSDG